MPNKTLNHFKRILHAALTLVAALTRVMVSVVSLLAASAKTSDDKDTSDVAPSGGVLIVA